MIDLPQLLTPEQTATVLGTSVQVLAQARFHKRDGWPPYVKCGKLVRYRADHLKRWLEQQTVGEAK